MFHDIPGITNFPGFQVPPVYAGKTCIHFDFIVGAMDGEAGLYYVLSPKENIIGFKLIHST